MEPIRFRDAQGVQDAVALLHVRNLCADAEGSDARSLLADRPTQQSLEWELTHSQPADWTVAEAASMVVGYGHTLWDWAERDGTHVLLHLGWVAPAWRGQGIGTGMLARLEARCREKALPLRAARYEYGANASEREANACHHLETNGYAAGYTMWEMEYDSVPDATLTVMPEGYHLRPVLPEHHRAIWQSFGDAYDVSRPGGRYQTVSSEGEFHSYFTGDSADPALWFVAWEGSRVAGQALCRVRETVGEVYEVSVGFGHRRKGLARALLLRGLMALQARGVPAIRLYTTYENPTQAWRLYEQVGFRRVAQFPRWRKPLVPQ